MIITIFAAGSQGDIQPCAALAKGLMNAGHQVRLAAPENFSAFIQQQGIDHYPLRGDVQKLMASDTGKDFMSSGSGNPIRSIQTIRTLLAPVVMDMAQDALDATRGSDGLICLGVFSAFGQSIAAALKIPLLHIEPTPLLPTREFPAPSWPIQKNLGAIHNSFSGKAMLQVVWRWYQPFVKAFRQKLGLPSLSFNRYFKNFKTSPLIGAYSPEIIPKPRDWPENAHIPGYFFLDSSTGWQPPPELEDFLAAGPPPVYIGFGSMGGQTPEQLAEIVTGALELSVQRGVLLSGWGGLMPERISENVFIAQSIPHSWLFPRMAAVVHHGGAGTTAEGLRAGIPAVITPFILDQPFWGDRIKSLGIGPAPIPQKRLTAENLAAAITTAVTNPQIKQRAAKIGEAIRSENGVQDAVNLIESYLGA